MSVHLPEREGTAAGRALAALSRGLLDEGHELTVWSWRPEPPASPLPTWCEWRPLPGEPRWRTRGRAVLRPRSDVVAARWELPDADQVIADDPISYPAIADVRNGSVTFHYSARLDAAAVDRRRPADIQDARAERRIARRARRVLAYSPRVAEALGHGADFVPIAFDPPPEPFPPVDRPVAACVADWLWPPNRKALEHLLAAWPAVRQSVPAAELRLGGRGLEAVGTIAGVEVLGPVDRSADVLAGAAAVAFPCPPSSGPKIKVLEAMAGGRLVVTTEAGVEGISPAAQQAAVVTGPEVQDFAVGLISALSDPGSSVGRVARARTAIADFHAPRPAARARLEALA